MTNSVQCPKCGHLITRKKVEDYILEFIGDDERNMNEISVELMKLGYSPGTIHTRLCRMAREGHLVTTVNGYKKP